MEIKSYDEILSSCLSKVGEDMDTREGSLAYISASALAAALAQLYIDMKNVEENVYVTTATGECLEYAAALLGLERRGKTRAVVKLEGAENPVVGEKFSGGELEYEVVTLSDGYCLAECLSEGEVGNEYIGEVIALTEGKHTGEVKITMIVAPGEEEESDESLRKRYLEIVRCPVCAGNMAYYRSVLHSIQGVGGIKVYPVPEGTGSVKVVITNGENDVASEKLLGYVKECLDPEETSGQGYGLVPIGHSVSVETVEKVDVTIDVELWEKENLNFYIRRANSVFYQEVEKINATWEENERLVLRDRVIEDFFFNLGATDVSVVSINGEANRLILGENQILGEVTFNGI